MKKQSQTFRRVLSFIMAIAMVMTLMPVTAFAADADDTITVYFRNDWLWTNVSCYYWGGSAAASWPGDAMTLIDNDGTYDIYAAQIPADSTGIIFTGTKNDGSGATDQTPDITQIIDGQGYYIHWNSGNQYGLFDYVAEEETTEASSEAVTEAPTEESTESDGTITVYFRNDWLWTNVSCYYWGGSAAASWPGDAMTLIDNDGTYDIYAAQIPADSTGIIFTGTKNDGSGATDQTPDITEIIDGQGYYIHWNDGNQYGLFDYVPEEKPSENPTEAPTEAPTEDTTLEYYLVGYINGSDYYGTNYAFDENGSLTVTLSASYVLIMDSQGNQYMTEGWLGTDVTSATLYSAPSSGDKLYVPAGAITFTLTENADGTLTLSYVAEEADIETIECDVTLHFVNSAGWSSVALYSWTTAETVLGSWPGTLTGMDANGYYTLNYTAQVPEGENLNFIFNDNGNGSQTVDLSIAASDVAEGSVEKWVQISGESDGKFTCDILDAEGAVVTSPVVDGTSVTFEYKDDTASSVVVYGSMNNWESSYAMTKNDYGVWSVTIENVEPGTYEYKFVVNGSEWVVDPRNSWSQNDNSAFIVLDPDAEDKNEITINIHYTRSAGDYDGWNMYIWTDAGTIETEPQVVDGVQISAFTLSGRSVQSVSFIPRLSTADNKWEEQESTFTVNLSDIVSGTIDYYVTSGSSVGTMVLNLDVVKANKLSAVELDYDNNAVAITTSEAVTDGEFAIVDAEGNEIETTTEGTGNSYTLTPSQTLDLVTLYQYKVLFDGFEYDININEVYASDKFAEEYTYSGDDLGANWSSGSTTFKVWAPTAEAVSVNLYESGTEGTDDLIQSLPMESGETGVWTVTAEGDLNNTYYTYAVTVNGETVEAVDPYARTAGINGNRGMVVDLDSTDPDGWSGDSHVTQADYTDAIIYELHVRDFSIDDSSGMTNQGKYLAFTETGTTVNGAGEVSTGIDYLEELGVNYVHLLPVYDYGSVDETTCDDFNWGYDPVNYNVPEGSYSTDPYNGEVRVEEFKEMVMALHDAGIGVVMDVVYNHVYDAEDFCFNQIVPGYFSRVNSNGSGCGNDTASEREMVQKYIVESVLYWCEEYHIDGFRFDLVGLLDTETINAIVDAVHAINPDIIFYGEGWTLGTNVEDGYTMATQTNSAKTPEFAYFSDTMRNLLAGTNGASTGYVSGVSGKESSIVSNFMANPGWTSNPTQVVQYVSCHDNYTLIDKLILSTGAEGITEDIISMNNLAAAIYMTSQGISFIHAGEEMLREKLEEDGGRCENSYNASDYVNSIKWDNLLAEEYADTSDYYQGLIAFRKAHEALRYTTSAEVSQYVTNTYASGNVVAFQIDGSGAEDDDIYVIFNANSTAASVSLPEGTWNVCIDKEDAGTATLYTAENEVSVNGISAMVLTKADEGEDVKETVTIYYDSTASGWTNVNAYTWDSNGITQTGSWPGNAMTCVEGSIWSIEVPAAAVNIIFNNGSSQTADLTIPTDGTNLYNGTGWSVYGAEDEEETDSTIYLLPGSDWTQANAWFAAYFYGTDNVWAALTDEDGDGYYECQIPEGYSNVIFTRMNPACTDLSWDSKWNQTVDLTVPTDGTNCFTVENPWNESYEWKATGSWSAYTVEEEETEDYYLFGYINGADYGCEGDWQNLGEYKFVDGTVTVEFEQDSYVGVKTGDNANWYMTDGWAGSVTSVTLYNTNVLGTNADKLMIPGGAEVVLTLVVNEDDTLTLSYAVQEDTEYNYAAEDTSGIQDGVTLHCWNWSFSEIEENMARIAEMGFTAIQTSPVQPIKEATTDDTDTVGNVWWLYYQPVGFEITDDEGNVLGTKDELISMIETAHEYGIQVIVDVVANHLANETGNDLSSAISDALLVDEYWHDITINTSDYTNRYEVTQYCMSGLPDLNTANEEVQQMVLDFLKECIDAGVDGFRFDAAKHIETPEDDAAFTSDFWPVVIGGAESYAAENYSKDIYCYGEVLDSISGLPISAYTQFMAITDNSWGNTLRENIGSGTAAMAAGYDKAADASMLVIWAESHDTYADGGSSDETEEEINMTWALAAARKDAMGLYLARPESNDQLLGVASVTGWYSEEVQAVNAFHNAFVGQAEVIGNSGTISYVERGDSGVVLVNAAGGSAEVGVTANAMADGEYADQLTGNTFTVANGVITGTIGETGIAVVYGEPQLKITEQPANAIGAVNSDAVFSVAVNKEDVTYQWYYSSNGGETWAKSGSSGNGTKELTVKIMSYRLGQLYRCEITDTEGNTVVSDAVTMRLPESTIEIVTQPESYTGAAGAAAEFTVAATGEALTYRWYYSNDGGVTWAESYSVGYNTATLQPVLREYNSGRMFKCLLTDVNGNTQWTDAVTMALASGEITIVTQPVSYTGALNDLAAFTVEAEGTNLSYLWYYSTDNGATWQQSYCDGYNTNTLSVILYAYRSGYQYKCIIKSGVDVTAETEAVTLNRRAATVLITANPLNAGGQADDTVTFTVGATGNGLTYQWQYSSDSGATWNNADSTSDTLSVTVTSDCDGWLYRCVVTDDSGATATSAAAALRLGDIPVITSQPESYSGAAGTTATFTVAADGENLTYQWQYSNNGGQTWWNSGASGADTHSIAVVVYAYRDGQMYRCIVTNGNGSVVSNAAVMTVE